jgi:Domain of unknown function (DUF4112)
MTHMPAAEDLRPDRQTEDAADATPAEAVALARLATLSHWLDNAFVVPGTQIRFGFDAIFGILPGIGDVATNVVSAYLVLEARRLGVGGRDLARMVGNILVDALLAALPIVGDIFDVFWRANDRNMAIVRDHLARRGRIIDGDYRRLDR